MNEELKRRIEAKRDGVAELTAALIRFPTVSPPGECYLPCAEFIAEQMRRRGFEIEYIRAEGPRATPTDTHAGTSSADERRSPGPTVHFNSRIDVVETGEDWAVDPFCREPEYVVSPGTCDQKHVACIGKL